MRYCESSLLATMFAALLAACASTPPPAPPAPRGAVAAPGRVPPLSAPSGVQAGAQAPQSSAPSSETEEMWESTRRSVRSTAEWLARGVDSWFGDKPFTEGGRVTDGRLSVGLLKRQDESMDVNVRFNARFRLPNLQESTYLFFGRDNQREVISDKPGAFSRQQRLLAETAANQSFFAGFGLALHESVDFRLGFRGGLKPYAQVRYRRPWQFGPADLVQFRQTLFWSVDERLGSTTALSYEHAYSSTLAARWLTAATVTQESRNVEWSSMLGLYKSLGGQRLFGLELLVNGEEGSGVAVSDYGLQAKWEQPMHKQWLLGEVVIGHFWPRKDPSTTRGRAWAMGAALKMRF